MIGWRSRRESNADTRIRNPLLYPFELREPLTRVKVAMAWGTRKFIGKRLNVWGRGFGTAMGQTGRSASGFENPRYGMLGSLRYELEGVSRTKWMLVWQCGGRADRRQRCCILGVAGDGHGCGLFESAVDAPLCRRSPNGHNGDLASMVGQCA